MLLRLILIQQCTTVLGTTAFEIGVRLRSGTPNWSNGKCGETLVMSKEMSATEVFDNYSDGSIPSGTIAAHWKFNGNALDETANNNDGTVSGATNIPASTYESLPPIGQAISGDETNGFKRISYGFKEINLILDLSPRRNFTKTN
jgi:hypothetical protein